MLRNVGRILRALKGRLRIGSLERGDFSRVRARPVENIDAGAAANSNQAELSQSDGPSGYPPGYVKPHDEGRPRR